MGYHIHTTLTAEEADRYARHAARVHRGYASRFGLPASGDEPMPIYLFRTQWEYVNHLARLRVDGSYSDGIYFEAPDRAGLAMFVEGRSANETYAVMQHEGFHQFSAKRFGHRLPIFLEEGLASYFQDGLIYDGKLRYGWKPTDRVEVLRSLIRHERAMPVAELMGMNLELWHECVQFDPALSADLYRQSWALVHTLLHGADGGYRERLRDYLNAVAKSPDPPAPSEWLSPDELESHWRHHVMRLEPDPLTVALDRLIYLGYALAWLHETRQRMPTTTQEMRRRLRMHGFEVLRRSPHGATFRQTPRDEMFCYSTEEGLEVEFDTLVRDEPDLPPRVEAAVLGGRPRLEWFRDAKRKLVPHIVFVSERS